MCSGSRRALILIALAGFSSPKLMQASRVCLLRERVESSVVGQPAPSSTCMSLSPLSTRLLDRTRGLVQHKGPHRRSYPRPITAPQAAPPFLFELPCRCYRASTRSVLVRRVCAPTNPCVQRCTFASPALPHDWSGNNARTRATDQLGAASRSSNHVDVPGRVSPGFSTSKKQ